MIINNKSLIFCLSTPTTKQVPDDSSLSKSDLSTTLVETRIYKDKRRPSNDPDVDHN